MPTNPFAQFSTPDKGNDNTAEAATPPSDTARPNPFTQPVGSPPPSDPKPAEPAKDTEAPAVPKPADTLTGWGRRRRFLTDDEVEQLRKTYAYRRELAENATSPDEWETVTETIKGIAYESDGLVTPSALNRLVIGESYANAPGPIDLGRASRRAAYKEHRDNIGAKAARSWSQGTRHDVAPAVVVIEVTRPGGKTREFVYPAGTVVTLKTYDGTEPPAKDTDTPK